MAPSSASVRAHQPCRFCGKKSSVYELVEYKKGWYAHFTCYLDAGKPLSTLGAFEVCQFPVSLLKQRGVLEQAQATILKRAA